MSTKAGMAPVLQACAACVQADRRVPASGCMLPATATEPGLWECNVEGQWTPYSWPASAVIEQAYCQRKASAEFSQRLMGYRVEFREALSSGAHAAVQVNVQSGKVREVCRWPSAAFREAHEVRSKARAQALWKAWAQADWNWVLLDAEDAKKVESGAGQEFAAPPREAYSLGDCHFREPWWPHLLQCWPLQGLARCSHPLRRCSFAAQRITPESATSRATAREWAALCDMWQKSGLKVPLLGAYRVQNRGLLCGFAGARQTMLARLSSEDFVDNVGRESQLQVRLLWHGTPAASDLVGICNDGFDRAMAKNCAYGKGCYFAASAAYSDKYGCAIRVPGETRPLRVLLLAAVLVGETVQGTSNMYPPPMKPHSRTGERYENACDNVKCPNIIVTFMDAQAVPIYAMLYDRAA